MEMRKDNWSLDVALLMLRLILAAVFMYHGSQKLFGWFDGPGLEKAGQFMGNLPMPWPGYVSALLAGAAEFFGGLILLIGTGTRIAAIPMAFTMAVAAFVVHGKAFSLQHGGMEFALTLLVVLLALILTGPGRLTLGHALAGKRAKTPPQTERPSQTAIA